MPATQILPRGLLTRAWLRAVTGPDSAQADLDEAWEIAEEALRRWRDAGDVPSATTA